MSFEQSKAILENAGFKVEDTLEAKSKLADTFLHSIWLEIEKYTSGRTSKYFKHYDIETLRHRDHATDNGLRMRVCTENIRIERKSLQLGIPKASDKV